jgi:hypothetical protein
MRAARSFEELNQHGIDLAFIEVIAADGQTRCDAGCWGSKGPSTTSGKLFSAQTDARGLDRGGNPSKWYAATAGREPDSTDDPALAARPARSNDRL